MKKNKVTISVIGDSGVGKTALSTRFISKDFTMEHDPTSI
jgi:GTPase SAR1 family protein